MVCRVRLAPDDPQSVVIRFFDSGGIDISEAAQKKIERLFYREDYRRSLAGEIGDLRFPVRTAEFYTAVLMEHIDVDAVRAARFQSGPGLRLRGGQLRHAERAVQARAPRSCRSTRTPPPASRSPSTAGSTPPRYRNWCGPSGAHLGAVIDTDGEYITFVDDNGHILTDDEGLMALLHLVLADADRRGGPPPTVALPVSVGRAVEGMCEDAGATLLWTKLSTPHLMEVASRPGCPLRRQPGGRLHISLPSCRPTTRSPLWSRRWPCWPRRERGSRRWSVGCPLSGSPTRRW